jgi:hypothetical protein
VRTLAALLLLTTGALAGDLPDPELTPGVVRSELSLPEICSAKWGKDARAVTAAMKREAFRRYGYSGNDDPRCDNANSRTQRCEIDHRMPRELGGADDLRNIWPQPYFGTWNAHRKDRLENLIHRKVCARELTLEEGQAIFLGDWTQGYRKYLGEAGAMR